MKTFLTAFFLILISFNVAVADCPCSVPCTGETEECNCFGPCGDDGYGCEINGEDYKYYDQVECSDGKYQVECVRVSTCSIDSDLTKNYSSDPVIVDRSQPNLSTDSDS